MWMNQLPVILTICLFILQSLSLKLVHADTLPGKLFANCGFTMIAAAAMALASIPFPSFRQAGPATLVCGFLFGLCFSMTLLFYLSAIACGPLSGTAFYLSASMILPAGAGILFFGEPFQTSMILAVICFLAAFYLLNTQKEERVGRHGWAVFCLLTFLCNGSAGIVQKTHQYLSGGQEASGLMLIGFTSASLCCLTAGLMFLGRRTAVSFILGCWRQNLAPMALLAAASLGGNYMLTKLAGTHAGSYLFPLVQGSIILGVSLCSVLFFHEKLSPRKKMGILVGILGIIIINI